jgi:hypothetical protein
MSRLLLLVSLLVVAACDPGFFMRLRQPLRTAPALSCIDSALAAAPQITILKVTQRDSTHREFELAFSDTTLLGAWVHPTFEASRGSSSDSSVQTSIVYRFGSVHALREEEEGGKAVARATLEYIRLACAPDSPPNIECRYEGAGSGACRGPA